MSKFKIGDRVVVNDVYPDLGFHGHAGVIVDTSCPFDFEVRLDNGRYDGFLVDEDEIDFEAKPHIFQMVSDDVYSNYIYFHPDAGKFNEGYGNWVPLFINNTLGVGGSDNPMQWRINKNNDWRMEWRIKF